MAVGYPQNISVRLQILTFFFEKESHYVAQAALTLTEIMALSPQC